MNTCDECGGEFATPAALMTHVLREHTRCAYCLPDKPWHTNSQHKVNDGEAVQTTKN